MCSLSINEKNYFASTLLPAKEWQLRSQYNDVLHWWRHGGAGVCALVGIGGAGKTAIAERFLSALPNVLPPSDVFDSELRDPGGVFVYSFYDDPNPDNFLRHLQMWMGGDAQAAVDGLGKSQLLFMVQRHQGLIVLDGLETIQDSSDRAFGRLQSPTIRDFLNTIASGAARKVGLIATSRIPFSDLRDSRARFFHSIEVDRIELPIGVQLLRSRGVDGSDLQLERVVEACGHHALTVDLVGGYLTEFGNGDPSTTIDLGSPKDLQDAVESELDDNRRSVRMQQLRFARIAKRYREEMAVSNAAALALLERICLFRTGASSDTLESVFLGEKSERIAGSPLSRLTRAELDQKLQWLERLRLIDSRPHLDVSGNKTTMHSTHPAVRDGFLQWFGGEASVSSHVAIRDGLEQSLGDKSDALLLATENGEVITTEDDQAISLGKQPGQSLPTDAGVLDVLEEIVHHTLASGSVDEAWDIYWYRMGNFTHVGMKLAEFERGERVCRNFFGDVSPLAAVTELETQLESGVLERNRACELLGNRLCEWATYLVRLGWLREAITLTKFSIRLAKHCGREDNAAVSSINLAEFNLSSGRTVQARRYANSVIGSTVSSDRPDTQCNAWMWSAYSKATRGHIEESLAEFDESLRFQRAVEPHAPERLLWGTRGHNYCQLLLWLGRDADAHEVNDANEAVCRKLSSLNDYDPDVHECRLIRAKLSLVSRHFDEARNLSEQIHDWATERDAKELLCRAKLVRAQEIASRARIAQSDSGDTPDPSLTAFAREMTTTGLALARECGYGLLHIELLLVQAELSLLDGQADKALADVRLSLEGNDHEPDSFDMPAATEDDCGYLWAKASGLRLQAEATLLRFAQSSTGAVYDGAALAKFSDLALTEVYLVDQELSHAVKAKESHEYTHDTIESMVKGRSHMALEVLNAMRFLSFDSSVGDNLRRLRDLLNRPMNAHNVSDKSPRMHQLLSQLQTSIDRLVESAIPAGNTDSALATARHLLAESLECWKELRDPNLSESKNCLIADEAYNFRADGVREAITLLDAGVLTRYPLQKAHQTSQIECDEILTELDVESPRVFISYTHDSEPHRERVKALSQRLRDDGIESHIDRYILNPPEGWPRWMDEQIEAADFVLIACTENYAQKAKVPKKSGGRFESVLILQDLYDAGMLNEKFIPIVFDRADTMHIPKSLRPTTHYCVGDDDGFDQLKRRLLNDPEVVPPPVGKPTRRGPTN